MAEGTALPPQVSPSRLVLDERDPHLIRGADVVALPFVAVSHSGSDDAFVLGPGAAELGLDLLGVLESEHATGAAGEIVSLPVPGSARVLLVGLGETSADDFRRAGAALARAVRDTSSVVTTIPALDPTIGLGPFVTGLVLAAFSFDWRSSGPLHAPASTVTLASLPSEYDDGLARAEAIARAGWRARFLATVPSNLKSPAWLADQAVELCAPLGISVKVWDEAALAKEGFGGILAVGAGSVSPPRLIRMDYAPARAGRRTPTLVLVGKGITFDTGGLNLKPGEGMSTMKRDMSGGAVVIATMAALAEVGCPVRVVGLVPTAENAVSGSSMRPGDVIRHYAGVNGVGRTSEVGNTDAEGRLVLADALAYAVAELKPTALVDIATLTGAMKVALGQHLAGLFTGSDALAASLLAAGEAAGEPLWRMPLTSTYEDRLASKVADAVNDPGGPGAITAALFLRHFTGGLPWAHLDIASVGDAPEDRDEWTTGPTGWGARTLLHWLGGDPLAGL
ncbi:leucyl aminopeptidase family protein [Nocardioides sp.]|uniref:leucyl aminopeptidase family protein n=1 Tax=Nocardioides sp. TaxID=35761 RepID=UPI0039E41E55